jgi:hypothetical protein
MASTPPLPFVSLPAGQNSAEEITTPKTEILTGHPFIVDCKFRHLNLNLEFTRNYECLDITIDFTGQPRIVPESWPGKDLYDASFLVRMLECYQSAITTVTIRVKFVLGTYIMGEQVLFQNLVKALNKFEHLGDLKLFFSVSKDAPGFIENEPLYISVPAYVEDALFFHSKKLKEWVFPPTVDPKKEAFVFRWAAFFYHLEFKEWTLNTKFGDEAWKVMSEDSELDVALKTRAKELSMEQWTGFSVAKEEAEEEVEDANDKSIAS